MTHDDYYRQYLESQQSSAGLSATTAAASYSAAAAGYKGHYENGVYVPSKEEMAAYTAAQREAWKAYYEQGLAKSTSYR